MLKKILLIFCLFVLPFFISNSARAHGQVQSFAKEVDSYKIEFEYDLPDIIDGEVNSLVFRLLDKETSAPVVFDSLLIRVEKKADKSTYLVARLAEDQLQDGVSRLTTMFPHGEYVINLGFTINEKKVTDGSFEFTSKPGEEKLIFPVAPFISFILGAGFAFLIIKVTARKKDTSHE